MKKVATVLCLAVFGLGVSADAGPVRNVPRSGLLGGSWIMNIPAEQYIGLSIFRVIPQKIGWFVEAKLGPSHTYEDSDYYDTISIGEAENWGDRLLQEQEAINTYDAGITYVLQRQIFLYAGLGIATRGSYRQYYDEFQILGNNGSYWIDGPDNGSNMNMVFGSMVRTSNSFLIQLGYDTNPSGLNIGIGIVGGWPSF